MTHAQIEAKHNEAMNILEETWCSNDPKVRGDKVKLAEAAKKAYRLELECAEHTTEEPSRSILYRSAASIAMDSKMWYDALTCVSKAFESNDIRDDIREELIAVRDEANGELYDPALLRFTSR